MYGLIWIAFIVLCYWLAKSKGLSIKKWMILGLFLGPFAFAVLALQKKSDSPPVKGMIKDQAADSLRTIRYSADNISSRLGLSRFKKK
jgi:hypothetical protein